MVIHCDPAQHACHALSVPVLSHQDMLSAQYAQVPEHMVADAHASQVEDNGSAIPS